MILQIYFQDTAKKNQPQFTSENNLPILDLKELNRKSPIPHRVKGHYRNYKDGKKSGLIVLKKVKNKLQLKT